MRYLIVLLAFIALPVAAQDSGFYVGGGVGQYEIDVDNFLIDDIDPEFGVPAGTSFGPDIEGSAYSIYGGWQFMPYLAVELSWVRMTEDDDSLLIQDIPEVGDVLISTDVEIDTFNLTLNPTLPIGESFAVFGKLGWAFYNVDVSAAGFLDAVPQDGNFEFVPGSSFGGDEDEDDFTYGVGGEFKAGRFGIRAEANVIDTADADTWYWLLSANFKI